jgi:hypothetical protein
MDDGYDYGLSHPDDGDMLRALVARNSAGAVSDAVAKIVEQASQPKRWRVYVRALASTDIVVEAATAEEAEKKALKLARYGYDWNDGSIRDFEDEGGTEETTDPLTPSWTGAS